MNDRSEFADLTPEEHALLERIATGELDSQDGGLDDRAEQSPAFARALGECRRVLAGFGQTRASYRAALREPEHPLDLDLVRHALSGARHRPTAGLHIVKNRAASRRVLLTSAILAAAGVISAVVWWRVQLVDPSSSREVLGGEIELRVPEDSIANGSELRWQGPELPDGQSYRVEAAANGGESAPFWQSDLLRERRCRLDDPELFADESSTIALRIVVVDEFRKVRRRSSWVLVSVRR